MPKSGIEKLPSETLTVILSFVEKNERRNCMSVCKNWYIPAKRVYYKEVTIVGGYDNTNFFISLNNSNIGEYIQYITIGRHKTTKGRLLSLPSFFNFCQVVQNCPNLLVLNLDGSNPYDFLRSLIENGKYLSKLESIRIRWDARGDFMSPSVKYYFLLANLVHRDTIRSLDIPNFLEGVWNRDVKLSKEDYLSQFPRLESLYIYQNINRFISFSKILFSVPTLKSLHYVNPFGSLRTTEQDILESKDSKHTNLQKVYLDVNLLTSRDMEYIMSYIPNVKLLDISNVLMWNYNTDFFNIVKFREYCDKLNTSNGLNISPEIFSAMTI